MRRSLPWLLLLAIAGYIAYQRFYAPCSSPLLYYVDRMDGRFQISRAALDDALRDAEKIWEQTAGVDLLELSASAEGMPVTLHFDDRQRLADEKRRFEARLANKAGTLDDMREQYEAMTAELEQMKRSFDADAAAYDGSLRAYNRDVEQWNSRGGAPQAVATELAATREALASAEQELREAESRINVLVRKINALVERENVVVGDFQQEAEELAEHVGESREFTQGDYRDGAITVYQFDSPDELRLVLAHEFGHALGIGHVPGDSSIMFRRRAGQSIAAGLSPEDLSALAARCPDVTGN
jgi:hypothetical protein